MSVTDTLSPPGRSACLATAGPVPVCDHAWDAVLARVPLLSERELDVFRQLARGASNRTIAAKLLITERTAKAHVAQILSKLDVESRLQAGIAGFAWEMLCAGADRAVDLSA
ncbi:LuxR C-terminal-related transcriptional regulator [Kitasatospora phosalacinea]|uniref:LuxR C-terminal-related transcriptional regulator n=1 Tax=Kitasatospora phosalacinea TaxID=2065 RepID=UPI0035E19A8D